MCNACYSMPLDGDHNIVIITWLHNELTAVEMFNSTRNCQQVLKYWRLFVKTKTLFFGPRGACRPRPWSWGQHHCIFVNRPRRVTDKKTLLKATVTSKLKHDRAAAAKCLLTKANINCCCDNRARIIAVVCDDIRGHSKLCHTFFQDFLTLPPSSVT